MNEPVPNPDARLDALFALARARRPDTSSVEYAFETRLMARLKAADETSSIWAKVSWRMLPFFAACVMVLALWHAEISSETREAEQLAYADNPEAVDLWNNLN
jgi:hypothetical protein